MLFWALNTDSDVLSRRAETCCVPCPRAAMVKPEKARRVEEMLIHAAKSGALGGKVTEDQFIQMLEQVGPKLVAGRVAGKRWRVLLVVGFVRVRERQVCRQQALRTRCGRFGQNTDGEGISDDVCEPTTTALSRLCW